jgi:3-oxoacyl-[acyl-carrier-protein] synthase II
LKIACRKWKLTDMTKSTDMTERRVVVTGIGAVSPGGLSAEQTWRTVVSGKSAVQQITRFEPIAGTKAAAPVPGFEGPAPDSCLSETFGTMAIQEAIDDAGLPAQTRPAAAFIAHHGERLLRARNGRHEFYGVRELVELLGNEAGAARSAAVYGACAGSGIAIGMAYHSIRFGGSSIAIAGGVDCLIREFDYLGFSGLYAMSTRDCPPVQASCPFDRRRDGFVMGEGAAFLILESEDHALARGARPRAVVEGYGASQNAYDLVASPPDALGPSRAMSAALASAKVAPESVNYINAHGTSTRDNDWCETIAIRKSFGAAADGIPVSSTKSIIGHMMAAAGAVEAVICVKALEAGCIPPTINLEDQDPMCDLDYVPWQARKADLRRVVTNSFGFGGHNSVVVLGKPQ